MCIRRHGLILFLLTSCTAAAEDSTSEIDEALRRRVVHGVVPNSEGASCLFGTSDADGNVALGIGVSSGNVWSFYSPDGTALGTAGGTPGARDFSFDRVYPGTSGFDIAYSLGRTTYLATWALDGSVVAQVAFCCSVFQAGAITTPIPGGGMFVMTSLVSPSVNGASFISMRWQDDGGNQLARIGIDLPVGTFNYYINGGVDFLSHTLAVYGSANGRVGQWYDTNGTPRAAPFPFPQGGDFTFSPLADDGLAIRVGDDWTATIADDGVTIDPAPRWLASRPRTLLAVVARGRRNALVFGDGQTPPPWPQIIELHRPDGAWAGAVLLPALFGRFTGQQTRIGRDGTVVQLLTEDVAGTTRCVYRFWPHLLDAG